MREKEALAKDWFSRGDRDLADAKILLREKGSTETICFLEARYPLGSPIEYPREDAEEAIQIAERIMGFIKQA